MSYLNKIFKILFYNCGIILIFIIILELFLGDWFDDKFENLLLSERNINKIYNFDFEYHKGYSIYKRDEHGFRIKNKVNYNNIDILFLGGSTVNQKFLNYDETIVGILNEKVFKEKNVKALNGGIDGISTIGHINSFESWLDKIDNLKPKFYIYFIGYNDHLRFNSQDPSYSMDMDDLNNQLKTSAFIENKSFLINGLKKLKIYLFQKYNFKIGINKLNKKTIVYFDQRTTNKFSSWNTASNKYENLTLNDKIPYEKFKSDYLSLLEKLTKKVLDRNAQIIYINQTSGQGLDVIKFVVANSIIEHCEKFKLKCINFAKDNDLDFYDFYDNAHLNKKGALKAASFLNKQLVEIIN